MFKLAKMLRPFLAEYKRMLESTVDYRTVYHVSNPTNVEIHDEIVQIYHDDEKYYCFDKGNFFYCGSIEDNDFIQTIANDTKAFGFVILAIKHLDDETYFENLLNAHELEFYKELYYVLGFCSIKLEDGTTMLLREYINFFNDEPKTLLN
jgi:hypothetical protein